MAQHVGERVPARMPGGDALPVLEPAPGRYVKIGADDRSVVPQGVSEELLRLTLLPPAQLAKRMSVAS